MSSNNTNNEDVAKSSTSSNATKKRRRRDLSGKTEEEKREDRLAANRKAAYNCRLRKRILIEELQSQVVELTQKNIALEEENEQLKKALSGSASSVQNGRASLTMQNHRQQYALELERNRAFQQQAIVGEGVRDARENENASARSNGHNGSGGSAGNIFDRINSRNASRSTPLTFDAIQNGIPISNFTSQEIQSQIGGRNHINHLENPNHRAETHISYNSNAPQRQIQPQDRMRILSMMQQNDQSSQQQPFDWNQQHHRFN